MNPSAQLKIIEKNHLDHFAFLPKKTGFDVTKINGVTVINCGLQSSMFNIVYGAPPTDFSHSDSIRKIKEVFNEQPFAWWIPPSEHNPELTKALLDNGFVAETIEHAMICDLADTFTLQQKSDLFIKPAINKASLVDFISVLEPYDPAVCGFYEKINSALLSSKEKLFVGYEEENPVTIGILFVADNAAGIFSLLTRDDARGKGYGTDMVRFLINIAKREECKFVTLSASSDSGYRIYERLGFRKIGEFKCFEHKGI